MKKYGKETYTVVIYITEKYNLSEQTENIYFHGNKQ